LRLCPAGASAGALALARAQFPGSLPLGLGHVEGADSVEAEFLTDGVGDAETARERIGTEGENRARQHALALDLRHPGRPHGQPSCPDTCRRVRAARQMAAHDERIVAASVVIGQNIGVVRAVAVDEQAIDLRNAQHGERRLAVVVTPLALASAVRLL